jgi:hypothetical protein
MRLAYPPIDSMLTLSQEALNRLHESLRSIQAQIDLSRRLLGESSASLDTSDTIAGPPKISD